MKNLSVYVLILVILNGCVSSVNNHEITYITEKDARNIAEQKIQEMGWKFEYKNIVEVYWSITPWDKYYPEDKDYIDTLPYYSEMNKKLRGRKYWSVYYHPEDRTIYGGDLCFFIDAETGEIIDIYKG